MSPYFTYIYHYEFIVTVNKSYQNTTGSTFVIERCRASSFWGLHYMFALRFTETIFKIPFKFKLLCDFFPLFLGARNLEKAII